MSLRKFLGLLVNVTITPNDVAAFINDVRNRGVDALPQFDRDVMTFFGTDPVAVSMILGSDPPPGPLTLSDILRDLGGLAGDLAAGYGP